MPPKFLENIVILCFERHFSKQNSVIRLKLNSLSPPISGLATPLETPKGHWKQLCTCTAMSNVLC